MGFPPWDSLLSTSEIFTWICVNYFSGISGILLAFPNWYLLRVLFEWLLVLLNLYQLFSRMLVGSRTWIFLGFSWRYFSAISLVILLVWLLYLGIRRIWASGVIRNCLLSFQSNSSIQYFFISQLFVSSFSWFDLFFALIHPTYFAFQLLCF